MLQPQSASVAADTQGWVTTSKAAVLLKGQALQALEKSEQGDTKSLQKAQRISINHPNVGSTGHNVAIVSATPTKDSICRLSFQRQTLAAVRTWLDAPEKAVQQGLPALLSGSAPSAG